MTKPESQASQGQPSPAAPTGRRRINWSKEPLGAVSDGELALHLKVPPSTVTAARRKRGIAPWSNIDWSKQPLGAVPDSVLARQLGVSREAVGHARRKMKLKPAIGVPLAHGFLAAPSLLSLALKVAQAAAKRRVMEEAVEAVRNLDQDTYVVVMERFEHAVEHEEAMIDAFRRARTAADCMN